MKKTSKKPVGFETYLGDYGPQLYDSYCGEPVSWGFPIQVRMGEEKFTELRSQAQLDCCYPNWFVITKELSRKEAIRKYGAVTKEEFGPRGGFRSVTLGTTTFISKSLR